MKFSPKKYLNKKINQDICNHEILVTSGFDEGMYGKRYDCLICNKSIYVSIYGDMEEKSFIESDYFIKLDYGSLTPCLEEIMKKILEQICLNNIEKNEIDIVKMFRPFDPFIDTEIRKIITNNLKLENKKMILKKYQNLLQKDSK